MIWVHFGDSLCMFVRFFILLCSGEATQRLLSWSQNTIADPMNPMAHGLSHSQGIFLGCTAVNDRTLLVADLRWIPETRTPGQLMRLLWLLGSFHGRRVTNTAHYQWFVLFRSFEDVWRHTEGTLKLVICRMNIEYLSESCTCGVLVSELVCSHCAPKISGSSNLSWVWKIPNSTHRQSTCGWFPLPCGHCTAQRTSSWGTWSFAASAA